MLAPFYFMFVFATHERGNIFNMPPPLWFGTALLDNISILASRPAVLEEPRLEPLWASRPPR